MRGLARRGLRRRVPGHTAALRAAHRRGPQQPLPRPATPWTARQGPAAKIRRLARKVHRMKPIVGSIVALVTPMHEDGSVDYPALRRLIDWHIAEGTDCIGVVGTTGESPTVSVEEHCEIIRVAVEQSAGRVPIMAGAGANSTREAIELTRFSQEGGRRLHAAGGALLQQALAGRHLPALQGHRRGGGPAGGAVQRARPHGGRHAARHRAAPGPGARHRRHQGSHRQHRTRGLADQAVRPRASRSTRATTAPPWR